MQMRTIIAGGAVLFVLAVLGIGLSVMESPDAARARRIDEQRMQDLSALSSQIEAWHRVHKGLPADLKALYFGNKPVDSPTDPETGAAYDYRPLSETRYELCATFSAASDPNDRRTYWSDEWGHDAGHVCFTRDVAD